MISQGRQQLGLMWGQLPTSVQRAAGPQPQSLRHRRSSLAREGRGHLSLAETL
jgi:hypothetical protein